MASILIVGCGDIGQRIGALHVAAGDAVTGVVRRAEAADALAVQGIAPHLADLDAPWAVPAADVIYWCAPPPAAGSDEPRLAAVLARLAPPRDGLLYIGTTGVYGDCAGRWINEAEPLKPANARSQRRLAAERHLKAFAARSGARTLTLRVPGIYGPGRLPRERLARGEPVPSEAASPYSNRIHADDLAAAAVFLFQRGEAGGAWHVSDGQPTTMTDYFRQCAALLRLPAPPEVPMAEARQKLTPMQLSFLEESKRLDTTRLRALGWQPRYASLAEGLPHCL
jgi:nucleoside-diphosphate-sugar epimerase